MAQLPRRVAILGGARIPFARMGSAYAELGNQDMLTAVFRFLVDKYSLKGEKLGEVAAGAVIKHSRDWNLARESVLGSGLHPATSAYALQPARGTSLSAIAQLGHRIALGEIDCAIGGGADSASDIPLTYSRGFQRILLEANRAKTFLQKAKAFSKIRPHYFKPVPPSVGEPRTGMSMGQHCEEMAKEWKIGRREQDEVALASHLNAAKAWKDGFFDGLVYPFQGLKGDNNI